MAFVIKRMQKILADENGSNVLTVEDMRSAEIIVLLYLKKQNLKKYTKSSMEREINQKSQKKASDV